MTSREENCLRGHDDAVTAVAFARDGKRLVTGSLDKTVRVWDIKTGREISCLRGHKDWIRCVCFSPDGNLIASGGGLPNRNSVSLTNRALHDTSVRLWDAERAEEIARFEGHASQVELIFFSSDGQRITSRSSDGIALIWRAIHMPLELRAFYKDIELLEQQRDQACECNDFELAAHVREEAIRLKQSVVALQREWHERTRVPTAGDGTNLNGVRADSGTLAYTDRLHCRALKSGVETVLEDPGRGIPIAWYSIALSHIATDAVGRVWAGADRNELHLLHLEGQIEP